MMDYRFAAEADLELLAEWNHQLIRDEGHRNRMTVPELVERMRELMGMGYRALIFSRDGESVGYALYLENTDDVYLRHFFIRRDRRRMGLGREAVGVLWRDVWPAGKRLTLEVLCCNTPGIAFWRRMGYRDYCLTMEIVPE